MNLRRTIGTGAVVASLALLPLGVFAQCAMPGMSHGGHEGHESRKESPSPKKKMSKQVRAVLTNDERRAELMDAVIDDPEFMREMVKRIADDPQWRAVMKMSLASASGDLDASERPETATPEPAVPERDQREHMHQH